jgi:hypothetical protein
VNTPPQSSPVPSKPKLRWYQFSLRTLLLFITLFACACSWFAVKNQQAKKQKAAVEKLRSFGYTICYDYEHYSTEQGYDKTPPTPQWILNFTGIDFFYNVYSVGHAKSLPAYHKQKTPALTDADMAIFEQLPQLRCLYLNNYYGSPPEITDLGMAQLEKLRFLELLSLTETSVTNESLKHIKTLTNLEYLYLNDTPVTDEGILVLRELKKLQHLYVRRTKVTDAGISDLQKALPNLEIKQ